MEATVFSLLFFGLLFKGMMNTVEANGWITAHATFYGTNQDPSTLGKISSLPPCMQYIYIYTHTYFLGYIYIYIYHIKLLTSAPT